MKTKKVSVRMTDYEAGMVAKVLDYVARNMGTRLIDGRNFVLENGAELFRANGSEIMTIDRLAKRFFEVHR